MYNTGRKVDQMKGGFIGLIDHSNSEAILYVSPASGIVVNGKTTWKSSNLNVSIIFNYLHKLLDQKKLKRKIRIQVDGGTDTRCYLLLYVLCYFIFNNHVDVIYIYHL